MEKIELPLLKGKDREKYIPLTIVVGVAFLAILLTITTLSLTFNKDYKLHYSETSDLDYQVYLKPNNFYQEQFLTKDQMYIASLIDYVNAKFKYTFISDENMGLEYSYYVLSSLQINDVNGAKIYESTEQLVPSKKFTKLSNNTFTINENIKIDYAKNNNTAKTFLDEYGISANAKLVVTLYIDLQGKHAQFDKVISDKSVMSLEIPLTAKTLQIALDYDLTNNTDEVLQYKSTIVNNPVALKIALFLAIVDVIVIAIVISLIIKYRDPSLKYQKELDKILREYKGYITETAITQRAEDLMKTKSLRIEIVTTFEGLMDIRDNLGKQILYHEERKGEEAIFYLITDKVGYIYVMRAEKTKTQPTNLVKKKK